MKTSQPSVFLAGMSGPAVFVLGNVLLGSVGVFVHQADAHPITATWFRCMFGVLGLSVWLGLRRQGNPMRLAPGLWRWVLLSSLCIVLAWLLFFLAMQFMPAGMAIVLFHLQPLWLLLFAVLWQGERPDGRRLASVLLAMLGLALATGVLAPGGDEHGPMRPAGYWLGVGLCLLGGLCTAGLTLTAKRLHPLPAGVLAWWQCALGALLLLAWPLSQGWPAWGAAWGWLAGLGLIHSSLAYTLMYAGMASLSTARIAVLQFVYPAVAMLFDCLLLEHTLSLLQGAGMALMLMAIGLAEHRPRC